MNGLIAAKIYLDLAPSTNLLIIDDGSSIGGVWSRENIYPDLFAQASHGGFEYSCYPMPKVGITTDGFIPGTTVNAYFTSFARDHDLLRRLRLETRITYVDRAAKPPGWILSTAEKTEIHCFKLIWASGNSASPILPSLPSDGVFTPPVIHSRHIGEYMDHIDSEHIRNVLVVGGGKSAMDVAYLLSKAHKKIHWILREAGSGPMAIAVPKVGFWNIVDYLGTRLASSFSPSVMGTPTLWDYFLQRTWLGMMMITLYWRIGTAICDHHAGYGLNPDLQKLRPIPSGSFEVLHSWYMSVLKFHFIDAVSSMFWGRGGIGAASAPCFWGTIRQGDMEIEATEIASLAGPNVVKFRNGKYTAVDMVVLCTGYDKGYREFSPDLQEELGIYPSQKQKTRWKKLDVSSDQEIDRRLPFLRDAEPCNDAQTVGPNRHYRRMIVPHLASAGDRSILFVGQIHTAYMPLAGEVQALWGAAFLLGQLEVPDQRTMEEEISLFHSWARKRYLKQGERYAYFIYDFISYIDTLMDDLKLLKNRKSNPFAEWLTPYRPCDYRGLVKEYLDRQRKCDVVGRLETLIASGHQRLAFVTGANRGLGLGMVKHFIAKPNYVVVAAVRDPAHQSAQELSQLPTAQGTSIVVVKYDASVEQSAFDAVKEATDKGVDHIDYVVANAGIAKVYPLVKDVKRADLVEHLDVNVLSVVSLYQATRSLLEKSITNPVYAMMGSGGGALGRQPPVPNAAYGASKSILPWYGIRINAEDQWLNAFVLDPGWVQTEMGNQAAQNWGMESAPDNIDSTTGGMVDVVVKGTKEQYGGKVVLHTGEVQEW
ncbi:hypothetical protein FE257_006083 [Aspergillus nanangensis]|uniref:Uncharacterized protein n=1 Tax=Aspergillus nanangensis TaxID=2582783 RepID=A0AAD4CPP6_ASPNN|nr:hypothetical protein FE257_006083 [Aspergillus nanangensis]